MLILLEISVIFVNSIIVICPKNSHIIAQYCQVLFAVIVILKQFFEFVSKFHHFVPEIMIFVTKFRNLHAILP